MKKILLFLITLISLNVKANVKIEKQDIYYARYGGGKPYISDKIEYFLVDNNVAYCIEPGMPIQTNNYKEMNEMPYPQDIIEQIKLIGYYGYNYKNHNTNNYRLATQALIWNLISKQNVDFYTKQYGYGDHIDITKEKEEIMNLIEKHYLKPNIGNIKEFYNEEIVIEDTNNVLENYEIEYKGNNYAVIDQNKLILKITEKDKITLKRKKYDNKTSIFYEGSDKKSQMIAVLTLDDIDEIELSVEPIIGQIKLEKKSNKESNYSLKNAIYGIYNLNNELIKKVTTNELGKAETTINKGSYYLKEINPPIGYELDLEKYYFEINKEESIKYITVEDKIIESKIIINKKYGNEIKYNEPNVIFEIYQDNILIEKIKTNNEGTAQIILPYGKYLVKQVNTKEGYIKVDDFIINVDGTKKEIYYELIDEEINAFIKIIKKDYETNEVIKRKGIKFKIKDIDNNKYICENNECIYETNEEGYLITNNRLKGNLEIEELNENLNGYLWNEEKIKIYIGDNIIDTYVVEFKNKRVKGQIKIIKKGENEYLENVKFNLYANEDIIINDIVKYKKDELVDSNITSKEGILIFNNLELGKYYIKEIETNNNYILDENKYLIELKHDNTINKTLEINNYKKRGKLIIYKIDSLTKEKLKDAVIQIYKDNELIDEKTTNEDGIIELDLLEGKYYLIEKEAPTGYIKEENIIDFEIKYNETKEIYLENDFEINVPNTIKNDYNYIFILFIIWVLKYEIIN